MPTVPTVTGRQVESRGFQSPGFQAFEQPNIGDALTQVGGKALDVFLRQNSARMLLRLRMHHCNSARFPVIC